MILSQDAVIYPPADADDPAPTVPTLEPNASAPCSKKLGLCQSGSTRRPRWLFRLSRRDQGNTSDPDLGPVLERGHGWNLAKLAGAQPGGGFPSNRVKYRLKGTGGQEGITVDATFLPDDLGLHRIRQTIRIDNVCYTAVLSCLQPPGGTKMKCFSRQAGEVEPEP